VPWYRVRLRVRVGEPVRTDQVTALDGGRWNALARQRGNDLHVTLTIDGGDVVGGLVRAMNVVLDVVPGEIERAEVAITEVPERPTSVRRRRYK
jgi:hypothetical protein